MDAGRSAARGDWRGCADSYLAAYQGSSRRWTCKYNCWSGYTSVLAEDRFAPTDADVRALKRVADDDAAPTLDRANATFARGYVLKNRGDRASAARAYRACVEMASGAAAAARARTVLLPNTQTQRDGLLRPTAVGPILDDLIATASRNLRAMEGQASPEEITATVERLDEQTARLGLGRAPAPRWQYRLGPEVAPGDVEAVKARMERATTVGGSTCDGCGKAAVHRSRLKICSRCKLAYYCSPTCQTTAWKDGHKNACRKRGEFKAGDLVYIEGMAGEHADFLNWSVVEIQAEPALDAGCRVIRIPGGDSGLEIPEANLRRGRPPA